MNLNPTIQYKNSHIYDIGCLFRMKMDTIVIVRNKLNVHIIHLERCHI